MDDLLTSLAAAVTALGALVIVVAAVGALTARHDSARRLAAGIALGLELLLAAGLLRLATQPGLPALGMTAAIVLVRQVIARGVRVGARPSPT